MPDFSRTRSDIIVAAVLFACGQPSQSGRPVRLTVGVSDTVVLNSRYPRTLPVRALDAAGRTLGGASIVYTQLGGDTLPMTPPGSVTCTRSGTFAVRASLGRLTTRLVVQCRVVEYVRIQGPLQFILGDSARSGPVQIPLEAYGADARPIAHFVAGVSVRDTSIATLRGLTLSPRARGITQVDARIGDRDTRMGVHVYQRVPSLAALDTLLRVSPGQRLFAVPLSLSPGEFIRERLPRGEWMLVMVPEEDVAPDRIRLRVEGARCRDHFLNGSPRRWGCYVKSDASVVLYRPFGRAPASVATGYLLVRWLFG